MTTPFITSFCLFSKHSGYGLLNIHALKAGLWCLMLFCFFLVSLIQNVQAQAPAKQWDKSYGGSAEDGISTIISTADGGYLLGGSSSSGISGEKSAASRGGEDYWIVKIDKDGNKQWDKSYGGSNTDALSEILATADGGYLLGGTSASNVSGDKTAPSKGGSDFWIIKIDANGNKQWDKAYGGNSGEDFGDMVATPDGGYLLGGSSYSGISGDKSEPIWEESGNVDFWIIKISNSGVKQWDKSYGFEVTVGQGIDRLTSIIKTTDGNYLIGGTSEGYATRNFEVIKINNAGTTLSQQRFEAGRRDRFTTMIGSSDGGYMLGGYEEYVVGHFYKYFVIKVDANGNRQWKKSFGGPDNDNGEFPDTDSYLTTVIETSDKGYLLAGRSDAPNMGDKTEQSRGGFDYWLVKVNKEGNKQWDKTFGGNANDIPTSLLETSDKSYLIGGASSSGSNGDKSQANRGGSDFWVVKTYPETLPVSCTASGSILREVWNNVYGSDLANIPVTKWPSSSSQLFSFQAPSNQGDNYGQRIRGYICVPASGSYTFYLSGDNNCALYLSTDEKAENKSLIASITGFTYLNQWNKYSSQKSIPVVLQQGKRYYIEALQKETYGGDHLSVGWQSSATSPITIIPGSVLSPYVTQGAGKISREYWANVTGDVVSDIPLNTTASFTDELTVFETPINTANNYAQRLRGYVHPQQSGYYRFYLSGDNQCELYLSTDDDPANKAQIASVPFYSWYRQWNKYASQQSALLYLVAGRKYYIEALHKEGAGGDHVEVAWQLPNTAAISIIAGTYLSPFLPASTRIARVGVEETAVNKINLYPNPFEDRLTLSSQQAGKLYITITDNLGRVVHQTTTQDGTEHTLSHLKQGVYVVKVSTEDGAAQVLKVVKK